MARLRHLVSVVQELTERGIGLGVLTGQGAQIDTTTAAGRARGRRGGRKFALTKAQVRLAQAAMKSRDTSVAELAAELHRYVGPHGELRAKGKRVLSA